MKDKANIYFIGNVNYRVVKIGYTKRLLTRYKRIQTGNHLTLKILAHGVVNNYKDYEERLHNNFMKQRIRGEWFNLTNDIISVINKLRSIQEEYLDEIKYYDEDIINYKLKYDSSVDPFFNFGKEYSITPNYEFYEYLKNKNKIKKDK